jgi:hypothetical protein
LLRSYHYISGMQAPPTDQAETPIPTETVSLSNGPAMKAEAPIPTETVSLSNGPNMKVEAPIAAPETVSMSNGPTMKAEASILIETVSNGNEPHLIDDADTNSRKAAKRTLPWDLKSGELLVSQDDDNPARKKPRLEAPLPTTTDEAARETASPDLSVDLPPPAVDNDNDVKADAMTDAQPNAVATGTWTLEEDAKLTRAVTNTRKTKWGNEYRTDFAAVVALVPGRTQRQCRDRWKDVLDSSTGRASGRKGKWTAVEDNKLKDAVETHGRKNWAAIAALIPGRVESQCRHRWNNVLDPNIDRANGRKGSSTVVEDIKLKDAIQMHSGKNWDTIAALVPGRTQKQCRRRWQDVLDPNIDRANGRKGNRTAVEDSKLKDVVDPTIDPASGRNS